MFTQIEHSHVEQLNKASNLTETAFKILNSKRRRRRRRRGTTNSRSTIPTNNNEQNFNLRANDSYQLLTAKSDSNQYNINNGFGGGIIEDEIYDGQIDVDSNYTGFLEILGK